MSSAAKVDDRAWRKLYNLVQKADGASVRVGVLDGELADIAAIHEYGAPRANIPARPFIGTTFRVRRAELVTVQARVASAILAGRLSAARAMEVLGMWLVGAIKETITKGDNFVPNATATIRKKGSARPLIDTGQMFNSIRFEVRP